MRIYPHYATCAIDLTAVSVYKCECWHLFPKADKKFGPQSEICK